MTKWPNDAIEGVKVHKVIPRPTALRAVGKNRKSSYPCGVINILACWCRIWARYFEA
jgi:hypothetical protein